MLSTAQAFLAFYLFRRETPSSFGTHLSSGLSLCRTHTDRFQGGSSSHSAPPWFLIMCLPQGDTCLFMYSFIKNFKGDINQLWGIHSICPTNHLKLSSSIWKARLMKVQFTTECFLQPGELPVYFGKPEKLALERQTDLHLSFCRTACTTCRFCCLGAPFLSPFTIHFQQVPVEAEPVIRS